MVASGVDCCPVAWISLDQQVLVQERLTHSDEGSHHSQECYLEVRFSRGRKPFDKF